MPISYSGMGLVQLDPAIPDPTAGLRQQGDEMVHMVLT